MLGIAVGIVPENKRLINYKNNILGVKSWDKCELGKSSRKLCDFAIIYRKYSAVHYGRIDLAINPPKCINTVTKWNNIANASTFNWLIEYNYREPFRGWRRLISKIKT